MRHFVPIRDELIFDGSSSPGDLVPYQVGHPCLHWEAAIACPEDERKVLAFFKAGNADDRRGPARGTRPPRH